jgi:hypothetical protein
VKAAHYLEGLGRSNSDVFRPVRFESECRGIDLGYRLLCRGIISCGDGEAIDAVTIASERLQVIEVQPDSKFASRDFGWIVPAPYNCRDYDRITDWRLRNGGQNDTVAYANVSIGGESLIDRNGALRRLKEKQGCDKRNDHALNLARGRMLAAS